jgi:hypothetical protein
MMQPDDRSRQERDLERQIATFVESARRLSRLARTIAHLPAELRELQVALGQLAAGAVPPVRPALPPTDVGDASMSEPALPPGRLSTFASGEPAGGGAGRRDLHEPIPPPAGIGTITVTVAQEQGTLNLVRVYDALASLPQSSSLGLTKYERSRASILISIDRGLARTAIPETLRAAFPRGVRGEWLSDTEYEAVLDAGEAAT